MSRLRYYNQVTNFLKGMVVINSCQESEVELGHVCSPTVSSHVGYLQSRSRFHGSQSLLPSNNHHSDAVLASTTPPIHSSTSFGKRDSKSFFKVLIMGRRLPWKREEVLADPPQEVKPPAPEREKVRERVAKTGKESNWFFFPKARFQYLG